MKMLVAGLACWAMVCGCWPVMADDRDRAEALSPQPLPEFLGIGILQPGEEPSPQALSGLPQRLRSQTTPTDSSASLWVSAAEIEKERRFEQIRQRLLQLIVERSSGANPQAVPRGILPPAPLPFVLEDHPSDTKRPPLDRDGTFDPSQTQRPESAATQPADNLTLGHSPLVPQVRPPNETPGPHEAAPLTDGWLHAPVGLPETERQSVSAPGTLGGSGSLNNQGEPRREHAGEPALIDANPTPIESLPSHLARRGTGEPSTRSFSPEDIHVLDSERTEESDPVVHNATSVAERLELADGLFASGETALAFAAYREIDRTRLSLDDDLWVQFQLGNCQRRLRQYSQAREHYQSVLDRDPQGWLGETARWWINALGRREQIEREVVKVSQLIEEARNGQFPRSDQ